MAALCSKILHTEDKNINVFNVTDHVRKRGVGDMTQIIKSKKVIRNEDTKERIPLQQFLAPTHKYLLCDTGFIKLGLKYW
jgi:hypothetical protein